jgi:hypothetical protein
MLPVVMFPCCYISPSATSTLPTCNFNSTNLNDERGSQQQEGIKARNECATRAETAHGNEQLANGNEQQVVRENLGPQAASAASMSAKVRPLVSGTCSTSRPHVGNVCNS